MATEAVGALPLTHLEQTVAAKVAQGEMLDLVADGCVDEQAMRSWGSARTICAAVVRDIVRGRLAPDPDPHGLRVRGLRIAGRVDLENVTSTVNIELTECLLDDGMNARGARLPFLSLTGCRLNHSSQPPFEAERLTAAGLRLNGTVIIGDCERGAANLVGARLGDLLGDGAILRNSRGPALYAENLHVERGISLRRGFKATGAGELGAVNLLGARVGGQLECDNAKIRNNSGPGLNAESLRSGGAVFLRDAFKAVGAGELGAVDLVNARIGGSLDLNGATLRNNSGPALFADNLQVDGSVALRLGFKAVGAGELGAIRFHSARMGGPLKCDGAKLRNNSGPALLADNLRVDGSVALRLGFKAVGAGELGAVDLVNASICGEVDLTAAVLRNKSGAALNAEQLEAEGALFLGRVTAVGARQLGTVRLVGAHVGWLECKGGRLRNKSGPALVAHNMRVDRNTLLVDGFEAVSGDAVSGDDAAVAVDLRDMRVGGTFVIDPAGLENTADAAARISMDGLTYSGLPVTPVEMPPDAWLRLLKEGTPVYAAQPYQQFAAAHRAAGHDGDVRKVLMAQREDQIRRGALTGTAERAWARLTGLTLGYGYQPWRALLGLLGVVVAAVILSVALGESGALAHTKSSPRATTACSMVEQVGVGLGLGLPLVNTGVQGQCQTTTSITGDALTAAGWALELLAWAFATLFVAGFTDAVRKT